MAATECANCGYQWSHHAPVERRECVEAIRKARARQWFVMTGEI